jgi:hypothetical protein
MIVNLTYLGVELVVEGTYTAGEPAITSRPPEDCYEGSPSSFDVDDVKIGDVSIMSMMECLRVNKGPFHKSTDPKWVLTDLNNKACEKIECEGD